MDVIEAINRRRAYRSLEPVEITEDLVKDLAHAASLAPSCANNQSWRFIFVYDPEMLDQVRTAMTKSNVWTQLDSMIIVVFSKKDLDCTNRDYYLFDTGMATALLILRATELGLVAHPIAGYNEDTVKQVLGIPEDMTVITLVNVGKKSDTIHPLLTEGQAARENVRPERLPLEQFMAIDRFNDQIATQLIKK